jgi:hypothetical protein
MLSFITVLYSPAGADIQIELILDGSGSMWETIGEEYKIVVVRDALDRFFTTFDDNVRIGLRVFGSRTDEKTDDCQNSRLLHAIERFDKEEFLKKLNDINPKGKSPLAFAIKEALKDFKDTKEKKAIIIIADGPDTCKSSPCQWLEKNVSNTASISVHVLGFRISTDRAHNQLYCIASKFQGKYFKINSQRALIRSLKQIIKKTLEEEEARLQKIEDEKRVREKIRQKTRLEVTVTNALPPLFADSLEILNPRIDGEDIDIILKQIDQGQSEMLIYSHPMNEGEHVLTISYAKIRGESKVKAKVEEIPFSIEKGKTTHIHLTAEAGLLYYGFKKVISKK